MIMRILRFTERSHYQIKDEDYPVEEVSQNEYKYPFMKYRNNYKL